MSQADAKEKEKIAESVRKSQAAHDIDMQKLDRLEKVNTNTVVSFSKAASLSISFVVALVSSVDRRGACRRTS